MVAMKMKKKSLEKMQYEAARVVTGLTRSVSIERLLREIGWVSLSDRRKIQKLTIVYKAYHNNLPSYLSNLFPNLVANYTPYFLRNDNNYVTIAQRTHIFSKSFIPSSVELWNNLDAITKQSSSLSIFKSRLKGMFKPHPVPRYFSDGARNLSVYHARIRNQCSNLNADLHKNHIRDNPFCHYCITLVENAEHYLFSCPKYNEIRLQLYNATHNFRPLTLNTLLFGKETLSDEQNSFIFEQVQMFIKNSCRFENG